MANHTKPTPEELEANAMKAIEEAKALKKASEKPAEDPVDPPEDDQDIIDEDPSDDPVDDDVDEDKTPPKKYKEPDPVVDEDLKAELDKKDKKLKASSREAQILYHRNKQVQEAIEKASQLPAPTDEQMMSEYEDWDVMSDFEKKMARESEANKQRIQAITDVSKGFKDLEEWQTKIDTYVDNPEVLISNPALEGRIEDFKDFATKPTRRGVDFEILVSSFLYQIDTSKTPKKKSSMFPKGTGGHNKQPKPKSNKITIEQGRALRTSNYSEYKRLLNAGQIESDF